MKNKKFEQKGTGVHIDLNCYNLWEKQIDQNGNCIELDRFRPFQSQICLNNQYPGDSGLEVIPGYTQAFNEIFKLIPQGTGVNIQRYGSYNTKVVKKYNKIALKGIQEVKRIPKDWNVKKYKKFNEIKVTIYGKDKKTEKELKMETLQRKVHHISEEHKRIHKKAGKSTLCKEGDYILWDIRSPHQNGVANRTKRLRQTMYHGFLAVGNTQLKKVNQKYIKENKKIRKTADHPSEFSRKWNDIEKKDYKVLKLNELGSLLYDETTWKDDRKLYADKFINAYKVTQRHVEYFKRYGYVVFENVISKELTSEIKRDMMRYVNGAGIKLDDLENTLTFKNWSKIGGKFGAMLELYFTPGMEKARMEVNPYSITVQMIEKIYLQPDNDSDDKKSFSESTEPFIKHPFGKFDAYKLNLYIDRVNLRFPSTKKK